MSEMLIDPRPSFADLIGPDSAASGPLALRLLEFTPDGAAAGDVPVQAGVPGICVVPFTRGGVDPIGWLLGARADVIAKSLRAHLPDAHDRELAQLRALIGGPTLRQDGLPRYARTNATRSEAVAAWNESLRRPKLGANTRAVVLAISSDLCELPLIPDDDATRGPDGQPIDWSGANMIGLADHRMWFSGRLNFEMKPDKAYKARTRGRKILSAVGAWPWAHATDGRLPRGWQSDRTFIEPLEDWVRGAASQ